MCEESHQPFQVLRRGRQEELLIKLTEPGNRSEGRVD